MSDAAPATLDALPLDTDALMARVDAVTEAQIRPDQVDLLYRQMPASSTLMLVVAAVVTLLVGEAVPRAALLQWWVAIVCVAAGRYALVQARARSANAADPKWLRWYTLGAFSSGAVWGFGGAVFFPAGSVEQQVFLAFVLAGVFSGAIPLFASVWQVYVAFALAMVIPIAYVFAAFGKTLFTYVAVMMPVFLAVNAAAAMRLSRVFAEGLRLRRAFRDLAAQHAHLNGQLQAQLDELAVAHEQVEASGRKLALYTERAPIAVLEVDEDGTIMNVNPTAEHMFGYAAPELEGRSLLRVLIAADETALREPWWPEFTHSRAPQSGIKLRCQRRDGLPIHCEFSLTPLVGTAGELISVIVQCQDITRQLEAERMKQEFTSTLSHELRTPLTSIIGSLQLLNSGVMGDLDPDVGELTRVAERNGARLLDMINDILDIEKIESGRFTLDLDTVALDALVKESLVLNRAFAERFRVQLALHGEHDPVNVVVDRKRMLQVLTNLISNAAKFSPEGAAVDVSLWREDGRVRVCVDDRGSGIPPEFRSRMFSRFAQADSAYTRKKGGTGLGLAISKHLVELMHGSIGFEDREGGGTRFYVVLPVEGSEGAPAPATAS